MMGFKIHCCKFSLKTKMNFADTDEIIEKKFSEINEIFEQKGKKFFEIQKEGI